MQRWAPIAMSFILGGFVGFLMSESLFSKNQLADLAGRIASLEVTSKAPGGDKLVTELTERVSLLEKKGRSAEVPVRAAAVAAAQQASLEGAPVRGKVDAPVTIVAFSDFQCPFCGRVHPTLLRLLEEYPETVRLVFKHYPLAFHQDAPLAHRASMAAERQGRFWEMHDKIFTSGRDLSRPALIEHARDLELDIDQFTRDLDSSELIAKLNEEIAEGSRLGITGTPTFHINGQVISGAQPYENFKALVDREVARFGVSLN